MSDRFKQAADEITWTTPALPERIRLTEYGVDAVARVMREQIREFAALIMHGDYEHRKWLDDAAEQYIKDGTVPPRGKGT